jgi:hypothetical protein
MDVTTDAQELARHDVQLKIKTGRLVTYQDLEATGLDDVSVIMFESAFPQGAIINAQNLLTAAIEGVDLTMLAMCVLGLERANAFDVATAEATEKFYRETNLEYENRQVGQHSWEAYEEFLNTPGSVSKLQAARPVWEAYEEYFNTAKLALYEAQSQALAKILAE